METYKKLAKGLILFGMLTFLFIIMSLSPTKEVKKDSVFKPYEEFGITESEDIYTDTIDLRLYTSHGRLKYNIKDN
jgi:hypothetical protein